MRFERKLVAGEKAWRENEERGMKWIGVKMGGGGAGERTVGRGENRLQH
jgi:hypothetical protein